MKQFTFTITSHFDEVQTWTVEAETIEDALAEVCKTCIEEDDTGWFFELDDADVAELEKDPNFFRFTVDGYEYGVILDNFYEDASDENVKLDTLLSQLGITIEQFEAIQDWDNNFRFDEDSDIGFDFDEYWITNPFYIDDGNHIELHGDWYEKLIYAINEYGFSNIKDFCHQLIEDLGV